MIFRRLGLLLGGALLLAVSHGAQAALVYDVRLEAGQSDYVIAPGETVTLDLFATVTGTGVDVEGFQEGYGSILATVAGPSNGVTGSLSSTLMDPFKSTGAQAGYANNLNGDTVTDIGSNLSAANTDFIFARASRMQTVTGTPTLAGDGMQFKLATITFTATMDTSAPLIEGTTVNIKFQLPTFTGLTNIQALWEEDGVFKTASAGSSSHPTVGSSVTITVIPEPSSAVLLLGGLAACGLRSRRTR